MNNELQVIQSKVNDVIYNPFINLKDQIKNIKKLLTDSEKYESEIVKLDTAIRLLDEFENMPYGNLERIKGFNKIKGNVLKVIKELANTQ